MRDILGDSVSRSDQFKKMEEKKIPGWVDYDEVPSLRLEARQKLKEFQPVSVGTGIQNLRSFTGRYICSSCFSWSIMEDSSRWTDGML